MTVTCHYPEPGMKLTLARDYQVIQMDRYQTFVKVRNDDGEIDEYPLSVFDNCWY